MAQPDPELAGVKRRCMISLFDIGAKAAQRYVALTPVVGPALSRVVTDVDDVCKTNRDFVEFREYIADRAVKQVDGAVLSVATATKTAGKTALSGDCAIMQAAKTALSSSAVAKRLIASAVGLAGVVTYHQCIEKSGAGGAPCTKELSQFPSLGASAHAGIDAAGGAGGAPSATAKGLIASAAAAAGSFAYHQCIDKSGAGGAPCTKELSQFPSLGASAHAGIVAAGLLSTMAIGACLIAAAEVVTPSAPKGAAV